MNHLVQVIYAHKLKLEIHRRLSKLKRKAYHAIQTIRGFKPYHTDVDLEKVLIGNQCGKTLEKWVRKTHEWDRVSCLLKDSPYVHFLTEVSGNERLLANDSFLENHPYYRMAETAVEFTGSYFGAKTPDALKRQMRSFYETYRSFRAGRQNSAAHDDYRHSAPGDPVVMHKVFASDCYELDDGHHRAAISYVLGKRKMPALIAGEKKTYLQKLLLRCRQAKEDAVLYQPVEKPEVADWTVKEGGEEQMELLAAFLAKANLKSKVTTALDIECGYGWFVHKLRKMGFDATGINRNATLIAVGRIAYGLTVDQLRNEDISAFLDKPYQRYDLVLFLNALDHLSSGSKPEDEVGMLGKIDQLTRNVLILDSGQNCETCSSDNLLRWDHEHVKSRILQNTSFRQVIALGEKSDNAEKCRDRKTGILLACIR